MKILLMLISLSVFAELEPKTVMLDMENAPQVFMAMEGKERCRMQGHKAQERADAICFAYRHLSAVHGGFTTVENVDLDYMMKAISLYSFKEIDPKIYECKNSNFGVHKVILRPTKFVKVNCLTE